MMKNEDEIALIITASMMEAGMRDDQEINELPVAIRKLKEQATLVAPIGCAAAGKGWIHRLVMWAAGKLGYYLVRKQTVKNWLEVGQELYNKAMGQPINSMMRNQWEGQANGYRHAAGDVIGTSPRYKLPT